jgi:hypothetical protein
MTHVHDSFASSLVYVVSIRPISRAVNRAM